MARNAGVGSWEKNAGPMSKWKRYAIIGGIVLLGIGIFFGIRAIIYYTTHVMTATASVEGTIIAVSPRSSSRITAIAVESGREVKAGDVIAVLDQEALEAAAREAQARLAAAQAEVSVSTAALEKEIALSRGGVQGGEAEVEIAVSQLGQAGARRKFEESRSAQELARTHAALEAAKQSLAILQAGPRPQEIEAARAYLKAAKAREEAAAKDYDRKAKLLDKGYIAAGEVDQAKANAEVAQAQSQEATLALDLLLSGNRKESVEVAKQEVAQAQAAFAIAQADAMNTAQRNQQLAQAGHEVKRARAGLTGAQASRGQVEMSRRQVAAALAQVEIAQAGLRAARSALAEAKIKSPISGVVAEIRVHAGEFVGPGQPVALIVSGRKFWIRATVSEMDVSKVRAGQPALIELYAYPKIKIPGKVRVVGRATLARTKGSGSAAGESDNSAVAFAPEVPVTIEFDYGKLRLSPGMSASAVIDISKG